MKQLEELEKKVLDLIESNKQLQGQVDTLKKENSILKETNSGLESTLLKEHKNIDLLSKEKEVIKGTIESLLKTIDKLENVKD